jgi:hypothetical protein
VKLGAILCNGFLTEANEGNEEQEMHGASPVRATKLRPLLRAGMEEPEVPTFSFELGSSDQDVIS